jgi:GH24 family phage-related lysozyme (muramidase)
MLVNESKLRQIISRAIKESYKINESEDDESKIVKAIKKVGKTYEKFKDADASDLKPSQECYDNIWKHESPVPYVYDDGKKMSARLAEKKYGNIIKGDILQNIIQNKWPKGKMPYPSNSFDDNKGYPTIGAGHLIKTKEEFETFKQYTLKNITSEENRSANSSVPMQDFLMPEDEMKELFKKDVDIHTQFKSRIKEKITQSMFDALTSIAFNSGWEKNKPIEKIIRFINKRKYKSAHNTIKNLATTSKGEVMQGLVDRRKEEAEMFMKDGFKS